MATVLKKMKTKWGGLWVSSARKSVYVGQVIAKKDIPKHTRILLMKNKYYKKDSNRPRYVYCFADAEGYEEVCVPVEVEEERLYTEEDVYKVIHGMETEYGLPYGENLIGDYL